MTLAWRSESGVAYCPIELECAELACLSADRRSVSVAIDACPERSRRAHLSSSHLIWLMLCNGAGLIPDEAKPNLGLWPRYPGWE